MRMDLGLTKKVAVVTGGSDGIGRATATRLVAEGARVVVCARGAERLESVAASLRESGGEAIGIPADVSVAADCERLIRETVAAFGGLDILVNNAGTSSRGPFESVAESQWREDFDLKLFAAVRLSRLALPELRKNPGGGRIINVTTIGGKHPAAQSMPSSITRAAGLALTKALSKEFAPDNVLVNTVCIGLVRAGQHERTAAKRGITPDQLYDEMKREIPLGRVGDPSEVANVIAFLASAAASFVTGSSVNLDGGACAVL
jgi:NAD(P)-dependent dehydrogenase (short-subunit alcohol dehydrogenase family)